MPAFAPHHFTVDMIMVRPVELLEGLKLPESFIKHQEVQASTKGEVLGAHKHGCHVSDRGKVACL